MLMPLYRRGQIKAFASVDAEDYRWLSTRRWYYAAHGYGRIHHRVDGKPRVQLLHRLIASTAAELPPGYEVDHIDLNKGNNRRANLRVVTHAQNHQNKAANRGGYSRRRGVTFDRGRGKWVAKHKMHGKTFNLGRYSTEDEAAAAAASFRAEHMPYSAEGR